MSCSKSGVPQRQEATTIEMVIRLTTKILRAEHKSAENPTRGARSDSISLGSEAKMARLQYVLQAIKWLKIIWIQRVDYGEVQNEKKVQKPSRWPLSGIKNHFAPCFTICIR